MHGGAKGFARRRRLGDRVLRGRSGFGQQGLSRSEGVRKGEGVRGSRRTLSAWVQFLPPPWLLGETAGNNLAVGRRRPRGGTAA